MKSMKYIGAACIATALGFNIIRLVLEALGHFPIPDLDYLSTAVIDTGSINVVTAILMDYRGFDTFGEATVIFTSVGVSAAILGKPKFPLERPVLGITTRRAIAYLLPMFFIFPVYIITHGHLSPGGGFQGGVSLAVLIIMIHVVFGHNLAMRKIPMNILSYGEYGAALAFGLLGFIGIFRGTGFLSNLAAGFPRGKPGELLSAGLIPLLNLVVGIKVATGLSSLYISLAGNNREEL